MCNCSCSCQEKAQKQDTAAAEKKGYVCYQCNTFKDASAEAPVPECCGKKMQEMD
jgi:hypothetical protein